MDQGMERMLNTSSNGLHEKRTGAPPIPLDVNALVAQTPYYASTPIQAMSLDTRVAVPLEQPTMEDIMEQQNQAMVQQQPAVGGVQPAAQHQPLMNVGDVEYASNASLADRLLALPSPSTFNVFGATPPSTSNFDLDMFGSSGSFGLLMGNNNHNHHNNNPSSTRTMTPKGNPGNNKERKMSWFNAFASPLKTTNMTPAKNAGHQPRATHVPTGLNAMAVALHMSPGGMRHDVGDATAHVVLTEVPPKQLQQQPLQKSRRPSEPHNLEFSRSNTGKRPLETTDMEMADRLDEQLCQSRGGVAGSAVVGGVSYDDEGSDDDFDDEDGDGDGDGEALDDLDGSGNENDALERQETARGSIMKKLYERMTIKNPASGSLSKNSSQCLQDIDLKSKKQKTVSEVNIEDVERIIGSRCKGVENVKRLEKELEEGNLDKSQTRVVKNRLAAERSRLFRRFRSVTLNEDNKQISRSILKLEDENAKLRQRLDDLRRKYQSGMGSYEAMNVMNERLSPRLCS